ncbi:MAG: nitrilase-related carbon-nitrogen hydrolase [Lachnospiraceae bacterium]
MKIAICQFSPKWEDMEYNFSKARTFIIRAVEQQTDFIVFPEMSFTGFTMNLQLAEKQNGCTIEWMIRTAKEFSVAIGAGFAKKQGIKAENHYSIVNKNGEIILDYTKIHPFSFSGEDKYYEGGTQLYTCELQDVCIGTAICYDLRFPEIFQILSQEAHLILVPANWPGARKEQWRALCVARAIENQAYVIGVNCVGEINHLTYTGDSCVINPMGENMIPFLEEEQVAIFELNDDAEVYRRKFPVKQDRRPELYKVLKAEQIQE